jgi:hypothetical protein
VKITYLAYVRLCEKDDILVSKMNLAKVTPGDEVIIPDSFAVKLKDFFAKDELVDDSKREAEINAKVEVCPACKRIVSRCKCKMKARIEKNKKDIRDEDEEEEKKKEKEVVIELSDIDKKAVELKMKMQKEGKNKADIKKALQELKNEKV